MRTAMLLLAIVLLTSCTTAHAATPTPVPKATPWPEPSFLKTGTRVQCQLDNAFFYTFTIRTVGDEWLYAMDVVSPPMLDLDRTTMWFRIDALSLCMEQLHR